MRWWEKTLKPNMVEIHSAQELVNSLLNASDRLVIIDFYSPACGGCKTLHPKVHYKFYYYYYYFGHFEKSNSIFCQAYHFESFLGNFLKTFKSISQICQLAESNPNALFLKVNYEELKTLCHGLNIHVLPLFRFYRGADGRLCSFSCTNATVSISFIQNLILFLDAVFSFFWYNAYQIGFSCLTDKEIQRCNG